MEESKNPSLSQSEQTQLETLIERLHQLFIESLDSKAFDLYIEPQVKDRETGVEYSAFTRLTDFITDPNAASLLLAGDPGMGKTLLSLQIAQRAWYFFIKENIGGLLRKGVWPQVLVDYYKEFEVKKNKEEKKSFKTDNCLPLWMWMPFLRSGSEWRTQLLETYANQNRLTKKEIELLKKVCQLRICRLFPIMDGWDELPPGVVTENLYLKSGFWEEAGWPYLKVLSTCRPEAFIHYEKSQGDYRSIFHPKKIAGNYTILNLSPFESRHIKDYVERYLSTLPPDYAPITLEVSVPALEQGNFDKAKQDWLEDYQKYTVDPIVLKQPAPSIEQERKVVEVEQLPAESQEILQNSSQLKLFPSQPKPLNPIDSKKETITVPGDSHCAFYALGIGLIENIYDGSLQLDTLQHSIFLITLSLGILKFDREASEFSVDEFREWVKKSYATRYEFGTYQILKEPLRLLVGTLLQEKWKEGSLPKKLCDELVAMAKQAKDTKTDQLDTENFKAIFTASHLKEGEFGKALKIELDQMTDPIGSKAWEQNLLTWLSSQETQYLYTQGIMKDAWASREIELPLLGHYFGISIYVDNKPIHQAKNHAEIGLMMQHGIHYDYQTKLSRLTAQHSAVLEMIKMGRGKANPVLEQRLKDLDQVIANIELTHKAPLKQEAIVEIELDKEEDEDKEKMDEDDLPKEESKPILPILPAPPLSQPDTRLLPEPVAEVGLSKNATVDWRDLDTYLRYLEQIRGLNDLVKTPFILSAVVQVLPTIVLHEQRNPNSDISRYMIYQYFVDHWLTKQAERLWSDPEKRANLPEFRAETKEASIAKLKACLLTYSENLARLALNLGKGKINVNFIEKDTSNPNLVIPQPGQAPHFEKEPVELNKLQLIRSGCLLKSIDTHFNKNDLRIMYNGAIPQDEQIESNFLYVYVQDNALKCATKNTNGEIEKFDILSLYTDETKKLDSFFSSIKKKLLAEGGEKIDSIEEEALLSVISKIGHTNFKFLHKSLVEYFAAKMLFSGAHVVADYYLNRFDENYTLRGLDLNDHLLTTEPSVIYLLADKAKEDIHFKYLLYQMIELSKGEPSVSNAAANAITILNAAGESFSGRDLRGINIRGAILNGALCESTDFEGADLSGITAQNACFASANFSYAQTQGLDFQELPRIKHSNEIESLCMAPNGQWLLVGDIKGYITQYSYPEGKLIKQWYRKSQRIYYYDPDLEKDAVYSLTLHPDERLVAFGAKDGTVQLINIQENRLGARLVPVIVNKNEIASKRPTIEYSCSVTFCSTAGRYLAFISKIYFQRTYGESHLNYHLQIWNVHQQRFLGEYRLSIAKRIRKLATCNQGNTLLTGEDDKILLFFIIQYRGGDLIPAQTLDCNGYFTLSKDECLLGLFRENAIHLYQTRDFVPLNTIALRDKPKKVREFAFDRKGNLLVIRSEMQLHFWDMLSGQHLYAIPIPERGDHLGNVLDFIPIIDRLQILLSVKDTLYFWPLIRIETNIAYSRYPINSVIPFLKKTEFSYADENRTNTLHTDTLSITLKKTYEQIVSTIEADATIIALTIHNKITQETRHLSYKLILENGTFPTTLALSPNQNYLVTQSRNNTDLEENFSLKRWEADTKIRVWDLKRGRLFWKVTHPVICNNTMFSMDSQWLVHGTKDVFIHRFADGKQLLKLTTGNFVTALMLSADKSWLAVADFGGSLSIFDVKTQKRVYQLLNLPIIIRDLDLTIDSQFLVARGKKEGALTFRVFQEKDGVYLKLIHSSMELNLACSSIKIAGTQGLSRDNLQLLQQNDAQGTPALPSLENHPDEPQSTESSLPRELTFDSAVVKRSSVTSFLNPRAVLDYSLWQVGLVRDAASEKNKEHTFIVVEGMDAFGRCFFWRFDLATKTGEEKVKEGFAKVVIGKRENILLSEREAVLSKFLNPKESKGRGLESLVGHVWQLKREVVLQLYRDVQKDVTKGLLPYAQNGSQSFFGGKGDSCYSWARQRLLELEQEKIKKQLPSKITDYLIMVPSLNLRKPLQEQSAAPGSGMFS